MKHRMTLLVVLIGLWSLSGCSDSSPTEPGGEHPQWVNALIAQMQSEPVTNPPSSLWQYRYRGDVVYYRPPRCCDVPGELYDRAGRLVCRPDGGLTGQGDGRCPDFLTARTNGQLIWRDPRQ